MVKFAPLVNITAKCSKSARFGLIESVFQSTFENEKDIYYFKKNIDASDKLFFEGPKKLGAHEG